MNAMRHAQHRVTFIVGAGTHSDYDMPTGMQLFAQVVRGGGVSAFEKYPDEYKRYCTFIELAGNSLSNIPRQQIRPHWSQEVQARAFRFCTLLGNSGAMSIDQFLGWNTTDRDLGTQLMATHLHELQQNALGISIVGGWNRWLFHRLLKKRTSVNGAEYWLDWDATRVVTFNYDTLLEAHLSQMIRIASGKVPEIDAWKPESIHDLNLPICHIYGSLKSKMLWSTELHRYMGSLAIDNLNSTSRDITIADGRSSLDLHATHNAAIQQARAFIEWASIVVFVGFGFDSTNLKVLGYDGQGTTEKSFRSTNYQMSATEMQDASRQLGHTISFAPRGLSCADAMRQFDMLN
ncbi:hypothetical protein BH11PLA1_BH11PLA1_12920 [soil metagenome]